MLYIIHLLFTDGFPSGQRGQTVNLLAPPSKVRILLHPANLALTSLRCRGYFFVKKETAKGPQSRGPSAHPSGFFKEFLVVEDGRVLTFVCMLRCWTWDAVPNWLLYSSVLHVRRYADTATFSQFRTGRKRPLPSLAVGVSAGDVASVRAAVEEV